MSVFLLIKTLSPLLHFTLMEIKEVQTLSDDVKKLLNEKFYLIPSAGHFINQFIPSVGWKLRLLHIERHYIVISRLIVVYLYNAIIEVRVEESVRVSLAGGICTHLYPLQITIKTACGNVLIETGSKEDSEIILSACQNAAKCIVEMVEYIGKNDEYTRYGIEDNMIGEPDIPTKEGEDEKKLLYSFSNQTRYSDIANLGLYQTLIGFFSQFSTPITTATMQKTKTFLYSPEPSFWVTYTVSSNVPSIDESGVDLLRFLCNTFIFLNGSFTQQFNSSYDLFMFKLSKFFNTVMPSIQNDLLAAPGRLRGVQFASMLKTQMMKIINMLSDIQARFPCVTDFALFQNVQLIHTNLTYENQDIIFTLFNTLRDNSIDFGNRFNTLRTANDERRIVFGIPEERARSKGSLAVTKDLLNFPIFLNGTEKRWVVFEHKLFFFNFFLDLSNIDSVSTFIFFLNNGLTDIFEEILSEIFTDGVPRSQKEIATKSLHFLYFNNSTLVKNGALSLSDKPDVVGMINHLCIVRNNAREIYIKGDNGKWVSYICVDNKLLQTVYQLSSSSTLVNACLTGAVEHKFEHKVHILSLIRHLYHELMNLGIVSFSFLVFDVIGVYDWIGDISTKYKDRSDDIFGIFELAHITIFAIALFLLTVATTIIIFSFILHATWHKHESLGLEKSEQHFFTVLRKASHQPWNWYWVNLNRYQFCIMKEEFIILEGLPLSFKFTKYITACFRRMASRHIHMSGKVWVYALILECCMVSPILFKNDYIGVGIIHGIGYLSMIFTFVIGLKLRKVRADLVKVYHSKCKLPTINFVDDATNYPTISKDSELTEDSVSDDFRDVRQSLEEKGRKISMDRGMCERNETLRKHPPKGLKGFIHTYLGWVPFYHSPYHTVVESLLWFNSHGFFHFLLNFTLLINSPPPIIVIFIVSPYCLSTMTLIRYVDKDRLDDVVKEIIFQSISHKYNKTNYYREVAKHTRNVPNTEMVDVFKKRYINTESSKQCDNLVVMSELVSSLSTGLKNKKLDIKKINEATIINTDCGDVFIRGIPQDEIENWVRSYKKSNGTKKSLDDDEKPLPINVGANVVQDQVLSSEEGIEMEEQNISSDDENGIDNNREISKEDNEKKENEEKNRNVEIVERSGKDTQHAVLDLGAVEMLDI
ncbi:hypothetical protein QTN25_007047 [Entamoeba marina]